ncbi:hypothetical protein [Photobacterium indicum]|uniref:hypothetical protein n=1 Tax=Photobacterium indicum TaxID=81447 RepID=UPI003D0D4884
MPDYGDMHLLALCIVIGILASWLAKRPKRVLSLIATIAFGSICGIIGYGAALPLGLEYDAPWMALFMSVSAGYVMTKRFSEIL